MLSTIWLIYYKFQLTVDLVQLKEVGLFRLVKKKWSVCNQQALSLLIVLK